VADKASSPPGYGGTKILVRRDHVESGRYRDIKDLKGMRFAMNAPGVSNTSTLNTLLTSAGLRYADVETIDLPFPDHVVALRNKSVDAAAAVEPAPATAVCNGDAVVVRSDDEIPPFHQIAVLLYAEDFALRRAEAAQRFMIEVYTVGQVVCRASRREAEDYYRHAIIDNADWGAVERVLELRNITPKDFSPDEYAAKRRYFAGNAIGGYPFVGTPDRVAQELAGLSKAGLRGIALSFVDYLGELPYLRDEVLPRLARLGVRQS